MTVGTVCPRAWSVFQLSKYLRAEGVAFFYCRTGTVAVGPRRRPPRVPAPPAPGAGPGGAVGGAEALPPAGARQLSDPSQRRPLGPVSRERGL